MRTTIRRAVCLCLALCLLLCSCTQNGAFSEGVQAEKALSKETGCASGALLRNTEWFPAGSSAADWLALTFKQCGVREDYDAYLAQLCAYVSQSGAAPMLTTDYARLALTIASLGGDAAAFGDGKADLLSLGFARYQNGDDTLNGAVYLLLAMDACRYANETMRRTLLDAILSAQAQDGGFGLTAGGSDADMTAMALQALAPYQDAYKKNIERALTFLSQKVTENGACFSMGTANAETTAQVLLALCALGIDPQTDARFAAVPQGLLGFRLGNGLYAHTQTDSRFDVLATQQSLLARLALYRLQNGEDGVYVF